MWLSERQFRRYSVQMSQCVARTPNVPSVVPGDNWVGVWGGRSNVGDGGGQLALQHRICLTCAWTIKSSVAARVDPPIRDHIPPPPPHETDPPDFVDCGAWGPFGGKSPTPTRDFARWRPHTFLMRTAEQSPQTQPKVRLSAPSPGPRARRPARARPCMARRSDAPASAPTKGAMLRMSSTSGIMASPSHLGRTFLTALHRITQIVGYARRQTKTLTHRHFSLRECRAAGADEPTKCPRGALDSVGLCSVAQAGAHPRWGGRNSGRVQPRAQGTPRIHWEAARDRLAGPALERRRCGGGPPEPRARAHPRRSGRSTHDNRLVRSPGPGRIHTVSPLPPAAWEAHRRAARRLKSRVAKTDGWTDAKTHKHRDVVVVVVVVRICVHIHVGVCVHVCVRVRVRVRIRPRRRHRRRARACAPRRRRQRRRRPRRQSARAARRAAAAPTTARRPGPTTASAAGRTATAAATTASAAGTIATAGGPVACSRAGWRAAARVAAQVGRAELWSRWRRVPWPMRGATTKRDRPLGHPHVES